MNHRRICLIFSAIVLVAGWFAGSSAARAEGRAAVVVAAAETLDPFVSAYAFEVASAVLRASRFDIAPRAVTHARLLARTSRDPRCAAMPSCLAMVAGDVGAPTLVVIELEAAERRRFVARIATYEISERGPVRVEAAEVTGNETAMAERVRDMVTRLAERPAPCTVSIASQAGDARVAVGDGRAATTRIRFLSPGRHRLRIEVARRAGWTGEMTCRAGGRYRVNVR
ncbi:MAG: hypothetical protein IT379_07940 [Deltaproteobacteria bacterium]|nr:hypothetical protein [Deltaproteobacteria bacterium]